MFISTKNRSEICCFLLLRLVRHNVFLLFYFQVSWIRKSDLHVLTSGSHTFTGDLRFSSRHSQATHQAGVDSWILQIKPTQLKDSGEYQCQVNTEPKISFSVFLRVRGEFLDQDQRFKKFYRAEIAICRKNDLLWIQSMIICLGRFKTFIKKLALWSISTSKDIVWSVRGAVVLLCSMVP